VLIAVPVALTWRQVRQEQLNHALTTAVDRNDTAGVRKLLRQGADPSASVLPNDKRPIWERMFHTAIYCARTYGAPQLITLLRQAGSEK
jgi:hypothetical protein